MAGANLMQANAVPIAGGTDWLANPANPPIAVLGSTPWQPTVGGSVPIRGGGVTFPGDDTKPHRIPPTPPPPTRRPPLQDDDDDVHDWLLNGNQNHPSSPQLTAVVNDAVNKVTTNDDDDVGDHHSVNRLPSTTIVHETTDKTACAKCSSEDSECDSDDSSDDSTEDDELKGMMRAMNRLLANAIRLFDK